MDYVLDTEVLTGSKWIDGKPIYRQSFRFESPQNGATLKTISDIDTLISSNGVASINSGQFQSTLPFVEVPNWCLTVRLNTGGNIVATVKALQADWMIVTFEYTKTTD